MPTHDGGAGPRPMLALPITQKATAPPAETSEAANSLALRTKGNRVNENLLHHDDSRINRRPHQAPAALRPPSDLAMADMTAITGARASPTEIIAELRFRRDVARVHALGARAVAELLAEVGAERGIQHLIDQKASRYATINPDHLLALGGDDFPPVPLHEVRR